MHPTEAPESEAYGERDSGMSGNLSATAEPSALCVAEGEGRLDSDRGGEAAAAGPGPSVPGSATGRAAGGRAKRAAASAKDAPAK